MSKVLEPEPIEIGEDGKPILGYIIDKDQLGAFEKEIRKLVNNEPFFIATKEFGDKLKIKIGGVSAKRAEEINKHISNVVSLKTYAESSFDPTIDLFD